MSRLARILGPLLLLLIAFGTLAGTAVDPVPFTHTASFKESYLSSTNASTLLVLNATACTVPGGASCSIILASTNIVGWDNITLYLTNSGANTCDDVLIEVSPDASNWTEIVASTLDAFAASASHTVAISGHYAYLRVEARAAAATTMKVWLSGFRP